MSSAETVKRRLTPVFPYLLERVQKRVTSKIIALHRRAPGAAGRDFVGSVLRTLQGEGFPNRSSSVQIVCQDYLQNNVVLEPGLAEALREFKARVAALQTALDSPRLVDYESKIMLGKKRIPGVVGGNHSKIVVFPKFFVKKLHSKRLANEAFNYFLFESRFPGLKAFTAKCYGLLFVSPDFEFSQEKLEQLLSAGALPAEAAVFVPFGK